MELSKTPSADRVHIGFFGCTNVGKSSLVNAITGQEMSVVSPISGTTTDSVRKAMELLPLGPVVIIDTPGFNDVGEIGALRIESTKKVLNTADVAVLVADSQKGLCDTDKELIKIFEENKTPYLIAFNKADLVNDKKENTDNVIYVSAFKNENIDLLKERIALLLPEKIEKTIIGGFVKKGDMVVLVTPIDEAAPKGRIILPQQQVLREVLDIGATAVVTGVEELSGVLSNLSKKPVAVITDSQAFKEVDAIVPEEIALTSFSILFAKHRGFLESATDALKVIDKLKDGDKILVSEGCTHHRQCNDIGTVKIPTWIRKYTKKDLIFETSSGRDFPEDLSQYALILQCGGCMITERDVAWRMNSAKSQNIPFTNYGIVIAYINGILKRSVEVFPEIYKKMV